MNNHSLERERRTCMRCLSTTRERGIRLSVYLYVQFFWVVGWTRIWGTLDLIRKPGEESFVGMLCCAVHCSTKGCSAVPW